MSNPEAKGAIPKVLRGDAVGDTLYSERWILKQLIRLTKFVSGQEEFSEDFETDLCTLWDMCADKDVIALARKHGLIALAVNTIMKSQSPRLSEIMVGIIGNMCTLNIVREECKQRPDVIRVMMELLAFPDSPTLIQVMRVLHTFAWEVSNRFSPSPPGRSEDGEQDDNDHGEIDHTDDYENDYDSSLVHHSEDDDGHDYQDARGIDGDENNQPEDSDTSEESSLSDNVKEDIESEPLLHTSGNKPDGEEQNQSIRGSFNENKTESNENVTRNKQKETEDSLNRSPAVQPQDNADGKENVKSSTGEEEKRKADKEGKIIISLASSSSDKSNNWAVIEPIAGTSRVPAPSNVAGPSRSVASTSRTGNIVGLEGGGTEDENKNKDKERSGCGDCHGVGGESGRDRGGKHNVDDDAEEEEEDPEVVAISVGDVPVISSTAILWYEQFLKVENWLPEVVYILNSSKNAELLSLTWSLLSILCYIKVGDAFLCCSISGPDTMRGLLESFKEFFGQHADLDNSEMLNISKCRNGLISWTTVMYSFTFYEYPESSFRTFKAVIMKNIFQMLTFFSQFLPMDGELLEYLIHSFMILDHILMSEPYELATLRSGIDAVTQLLEDVTDEKERQERLNVSSRQEEEAIDHVERYLLNVVGWLNSLHSADCLGEFNDVRDKLVAKLGLENSSYS